MKGKLMAGKERKKKEGKSAPSTQQHIIIRESLAVSEA